MALSENLLDILAYNLKREKDLSSFPHSIKINFLRNFTIEGIEPFLKKYLYKSSIRPNITFGNFNNIQQEILDENSHIYSNSPDIIVVAICFENLLPEKSFFGWKSEMAFVEIQNFLDILERNTNSIIAVTTIVPPFYSEIGITNIEDNNGLFYEAENFNQNIRKYVSKNPSRYITLDVDRLVTIIGQDAAIDRRFWYSSSSLYKIELLDLIAGEISKVAMALKGLSKKCLVLDCDNTLWEGVIGEDGLNGIKLDNISSPGKIFYDFHKTILALYERGVVICLCSKNNEDDVWSVLENHPKSLIKRSHISAYRINWNDKATNIAAIAKELNLGLDSFVFIDDSSMECGLVKELLPEVTVLQVPKKLYELPSVLLKGGWFDTLQQTSEDKTRTSMYQKESLRKSEQEKYTNINEYLSSLDIRIEISEAQEGDITRITQLAQKTNQFNFTTKRYNENEIKNFVNSKDYKVFKLKVGDKFGDMGTGGVIITKFDNQIGSIDTFLMSCRILGRKIEYAFIETCMVQVEKQFGINKWEAFYYPSQKNSQIADFWIKLGFELSSKIDGNETHKLSSKDRIKQNLDFITITVI